MHRWPATAAVAIVIVVSACGAPDEVVSTLEPPPSLADADRDTVDAAVAKFLELIAQPDLTFRATGELRAGSVDADGRPDILLWTRYDVRGNEYAGHAGIHLRDPSVGGDFSILAIDGEVHLSDPFDDVDRVATIDATDELRRPNAILDLTADDLVPFGVTDEGLIELRVTPWLYGDPIGEWQLFGAVPEHSLPSSERRSYDTRLFIDAGGVPQRLATSWSFTAAGDDQVIDGTIVDRFEGFGMYVKLPEELGDFPFETSHDIITGVDADHTVITEPFIEVTGAGPTASVSVAFGQPEQPLMLGIEGAIFFLRAHDAEGRLVLDVILEERDETVDVPVSAATVVAYYRSCDGNCGLLDPPHDFCSIEAGLAAGETYRMSVEVETHDRATCALAAS